MFIKYPSIENFRNIAKSVNKIYQNQSKPILQFQGSPKLHGTNAGVVIDEEGNMRAQSRNRLLDINNDNHGFAEFVEEYKQTFLGAFFGRYTFDHNHVMNYLKNYGPVAIYGEWCGGNIQKGVALEKLDPMFVVFDVVLHANKEESTWMGPFLDNEIIENTPIYTIDTFKQWMIEVDFNDPTPALQEMENIVNDVEKQCPVGEYFGVEGIGEGVVFKNYIQYVHNHPLIFKVKGEKHSVSKHKSKISIDPEKAQNIKDFVERVVTENRLNQGIEYLNEMGIEPDQKATGDFLKWVVNDVMKEEKDVLESSQLSEKEAKKAISNHAREWYFRNYC